MNLACMSNEKINEAREQLEKIKADKDLMNILMREEIKEMDENTKIHNATEAGKKMGIKEGKQEEKVKIAKKMLELKVEIEVIANATGLTVDEIKAL